MARDTYTMPLRWSTGVWIITSLFIIGHAFVVILLATTAISMSSYLCGILSLLLFALLLVAVIWFEGHSPQCIEVDEERITIVRRYKSIEIPCNTIISITPLPAKSLRCAWCRLGSMGLFGYFGYFHTLSHGAFHLYATTKSNLVLITTSTDRYAISCPDLEQITKRI